MVSSPCAGMGSLLLTISSFASRSAKPSPTCSEHLLQSPKRSYRTSTLCPSHQHRSSSRPSRKDTTCSHAVSEVFATCLCNTSLSSRYHCSREPSTDSDPVSGGRTEHKGWRHHVAECNKELCTETCLSPSVLVHEPVPRPQTVCVHHLCGRAKPISLGHSNRVLSAIYKLSIGSPHGALSTAAALHPKHSTYTIYHLPSFRSPAISSRPLHSLLSIQPRPSTLFCLSVHQPSRAAQPLRYILRRHSYAMSSVANTATSAPAASQPEPPPGTGYCAVCPYNNPKYAILCEICGRQFPPQALGTPAITTPAITTDAGGAQT